MRLLRHKDNGRVFLWTELLAERTDMVEVREESPQEDKPRRGRPPKARPEDDRQTAI